MYLYLSLEYLQAIRYLYLEKGTWTSPKLWLKSMQQLAAPIFFVPFQTRNYYEKRTQKLRSSPYKNRHSSPPSVFQHNPKKVLFVEAADIP